MDRANASLIAVDTAKRIMGSIAPMRWARHPLHAWRKDVLAAIDLLEGALQSFSEETAFEVMLDFHRPLLRAQMQLETAINQKRINKKHVIHAMDILMGILNSHRQEIEANLWQQAQGSKP